MTFEKFQQAGRNKHTCNEDIEALGGKKRRKNGEWKIPQEVTQGNESRGASEGKRPAPVEPEEGGGAPKRRKQQHEGEVVKKPGNCAPNAEQKRPKDEGGRAVKRKSVKCPSVCPHQRERSRDKDCGGASIYPHQRERSKCEECGGRASALTSA